MDDVPGKVKTFMGRLKELTGDKDFEISDELIRLLNEISKAYLNNEEQQSEIVATFDSEDGADVLVRIISIVSEKEDTSSIAQQCLHRCYCILFDFSDDTGEFVEHLMNTCIVRQCIDYLRRGSSSVSEKVEKDTISSSLGVLYNIAKAKNGDSVFGGEDLSVLLPYKEGNDEYLKAMSAMTLAFLSDEKTEGIQGEKETTEYLVKILRDAKNDTNHRERGFSCTELIDGLTRLSINDSNKTAVYEMKGVPLLMEFLEGADIKEKEAAAKCLWTLSFEPIIQEEMKNFITQLEDVLNDDDSSDELHKAIKGILLTLKSSDNIQQMEADAPAQKKGKDSHIMVSYSWDGGDGQRRARRIAAYLKSRGFKVWIDVDEMTGSILEAMASAVNKAYLFIMCVSDGYRKSNNCRLEAKYAHGQKKIMLPVIVDSEINHRDDWLRLLCSDMLFIDFKDDKRFHAKCEELVQQINRLTTETDEADTSRAKLKRSNTLAFASNAGDWGPDDVHNWLYENDLQSFSEILHGADGNAIAALRKLKREAPEFFYRSLWDCNDRNKAQKLMTLLRFSRAMDQL